MEQQLEQIREQQKESWNKFSSGWKKWDVLTMEFLKPMGDEIIQLIKPKGTDVILDIAAGTGEPGLTIATMLNGGKVIITDLAEDMLKTAREKATKRGIKNIETLACDVSELPFADNTFDAISCRFRTLNISLAAKSISGKNINPKRQLIASNVLPTNGSSETSQAIVSTFFIPLSKAFSFAISNISSERSVIITFPPSNIDAIVNPGSPVPAAISNTMSFFFGLSKRIISLPIGFKKSIVRLSHFFQPVENLFHDAFC